MKYELLVSLICPLITVAMFLGPGIREAAAEDIQFPGSPLTPFSVTTLDNGMDVYVKEAHNAPIVAVYFWCKTGSVNEAARVQGISHFYEHMFFKGTEKRGVGEIDRAVKSLGGYNNAFTSKEYTAYYVVLPSENFALAADVLVDAIRNPTFPAEEIDKERGVVDEEINRKEDDPSQKLYEDLFAVMFPGTPYAHPVLGSKETVGNITRDDFREYLASFYVPNNISAVVIGDVSTEAAVAEIRRLTADWSADPGVEARKVQFSIPVTSGVREFVLEKDVNMSYVMMAFQTTGHVDPGQNSALDIASSILGEGRSSRLYRRIVEGDQIASSVQAFIYPLKEGGMFVIFGAMDPANVGRFREAVLDEANRLRTGPVDPAELAKVKTMLKADFEFGNETNADIGQTLGYYATLDMLDQSYRYESMIDGVTADDLRNYVTQTLDPSSYVIGIVNPAQSGEEEGQ